VVTMAFITESSLIKFARLLLPTAGVFRDRSVGANVVLSRIGIFFCYRIGVDVFIAFSCDFVIPMEVVSYFHTS
jgi:hypothetical protein